MKNALETIKRNNKKVKYLNYNNWGRRISHLLIGFTVALVLGVISLGVAAGSAFYLKKDTINPAFWVFMISLVVLLLSLLSGNYITKEFKKLWFNFYAEVVIDRIEEDVETLTKKAFDMYASHTLLTEKAALPMFGYKLNENGHASELSYANLTYLPEDYIPSVACAFAIVDNDTGIILNQGSTTNLNQTMLDLSFATQFDNTLVIIATEATDINQYKEICELFNIPFI